ncbi:CoxG family protein [Burkholderia ubonensis]|uniref:CoxG family protein n=1 Tax=Burkholderia ubonensis TaxID=101571 RepID=UPI002ABD7A4E|nr:carbon monoxide dehydrogenase subunit G [Burkholderia ubonensis]
MEITGERTLALSRERVWAALNDPAVLKRCLPGCELFESEGENRYRVGMTATVGPIKARFHGKLALSDIQPPVSYALAFEGSGGAAGFGKGSAQVSLEADGADITKLVYGVNAQVGGRLAQVGARLVDGVAKKMSEEFFGRFARAIEPGETASGDTEQVGATAARPSATTASTALGEESLASASAVPVSFTGAAGSPAVHVTLQDARRTSTLATTLATLSAAVSTIAAAVAVLAAFVSVYGAR